MKIEEIKKLADDKRASAKLAANSMIHMPEHVSSGSVETMVDDIISCAILEIAAMQKEVADGLGDEEDD